MRVSAKRSAVPPTFKTEPSSPPAPSSAARPLDLHHGPVAQQNNRQMAGQAAAAVNEEDKDEQSEEDEPFTSWWRKKVQKAYDEDEGETPWWLEPTSDQEAEVEVIS